MTRRASVLLGAFVLLVWADASAAIPTITRTKIIDIAKSGVGCRYVWGGTCWNPNNKTWKGADCSGYVTVCWQIPKASKTTDCLPHYYTTKSYTYSTTHWKNISRNDLIKGDALVYNSGDKWGSAQVYEARGSAYGIIYRTKSVESKYVARRRNSLGADTPTYPLMTINSAISTISGQDRDFCKQAKSDGIFDWRKGQTTTVNVDVKNAGTEVAKNVKVGLWAEEPYLEITRWNIYSDWKQNGSYALNDTDGLQSIPHDNPGKSFTLNLGALSPGETKRVKLKVKASRFSVGAADHPDIRAWISNVDGFYTKSGFDASPNNVKSYQKQNSGDLRAYSQTDVLDTETCDSVDNDCDGQIDEDDVCGSPDPDLGSIEPPPATDGGLPEADNGLEPGSMPPPFRGNNTTQLTGGCSVSSTANHRGAMLPLLLLLLLLVRRRAR